MALGRDGIESVRSGADTLRQLAQDLQMAGSELKNVLNNNGNYQFFRIGTDKGTAVDDDLNQTVDIVVDMLGPKISEVIGRIESFCARQTELNNQADLEREETKTLSVADLGSILSGRL